MNIDLRILELLASKICHDLVSPVGAINNGVELINDVGGGVVDDAMKLISDSAEQAAHRLRLFRMTYGRAGSESGLGVKDFRSIAENHFAGGKVSLVWPEGATREPFTLGRGGLKTLLNLILLAEETIPYGGTMRLDAEDSGRGVALEVKGKAAQILDSAKQALEGHVAVEDITPRSVQSYMTGCFVRNFGLVLQVQQPAPEILRFSLLIGT